MNERRLPIDGKYGKRLQALAATKIAEAEGRGHAMGPWGEEKPASLRKRSGAEAISGRFFSHCERCRMTALVDVRHEDLKGQAETTDCGGKPWI